MNTTMRNTTMRNTTMRNTTMRNMFLGSFMALTIASCSSDDNNDITPINNEEAITTVNLTFTNVEDSTDTKIYTFTDDSNTPIEMIQNKKYNVTIEFLDESDINNIENITEEVKTEADDHFVFYESESNDLTITPADDDTKDSEGKNININTIWSSSTAGDSNGQIFLIHEPTTKDGEIRDDFEGVNDVLVPFNVITTPAI